MAGILKILAALSGLLDYFLQRKKEEAIKEQVYVEQENQNLKVQNAYEKKKQELPADKQSVLERLRKRDKA